MSKRDVAISSREVSVQVVGETIRVAQIGIPGPRGEKGDQGETGPSGIGTYQGYWNQATPYAQKDIVAYEVPANTPGINAGVGMFMCIQTSTPTGTVPTNGAYWELVSEAGGQGPQGNPGTPGLVYRGVWESGQQYVKDRDVVTFDGSAWIAIKNTNVDDAEPYPDPENNWAVLAAAGRDGTDGTDGEDGSDGKTIRSGTSAPGSSLGVPGDFYIETDALKIYGPKTADDGWGTGKSLKGTDGADALSWVALHFDGDGTLRFVAPQALTVKIGNAVTAGDGSHQVYINGSILTGDQAVAAGAVIAVVANGVGNFYVVSLPVVKTEA